MSRPLKFRAFRYWDKTMDYDPYGGEYLCEGTPVNHLLSDEKSFKDGGSQYSRLMQYTGLKDKNGREIYEGDVLQSVRVYSGRGRRPTRDHSYRVQVVWRDYAFRIKTIPPTPEWTALLGLDWQSYEVIGNIYENPQLLEDK